MRISRQRSLRSESLRVLRFEDRLVPAIFTVNSLLDGSSGSGTSGTLRYCLGQANTLLGDDTINIGVNGTITLVNGQLTLSDTNGQTTINGPGPNLLTIDADFASRIFQINSGVTAAISGVALIHGKVIAASGGGINNAGTLTITNTVVSGNSAGITDLHQGQGGGGIYNAGTLTVANSTISSNTTNTTLGFGHDKEGGGGIFTGHGSTLSVTGSTITGNTSLGGPGGTTNGAGGGICSDYGTVAVTNSTISGNTNNRGGGGIYAYYGTTIVGSSTINGNSGDGIGSVGEHITTTVTNSTIRENSGDGIGNSGPFTAANSTVSGNGGDGINNKDAPLAVTYCTITGNNGVGISNTQYGALAVTDSNVSGNGSNGIFNFTGSLMVTDSTISHNSGGGFGGGGISNESGAGTVLVTNSTISGNTAIAGFGGGGIFNRGGDFTLTNSTINDNFAAGNESGGGIWNRDGTFTLTNSTVSGNSAGGPAGGIYNGYSTVTLTDSTISGNSAAGPGGGVCTGGGIYSALNGTNTIIAGNQAPTGADLQGSFATDINNLINMTASAAGLGTLGNYGGPTQTIPLLPGSPAIDAGTSVGAPSTDQRGFPRYGPVDIGAFEVQAAPTVYGVMVNDGSAQRSEVRSLTITFSGPVTFAGGTANAAAAFQLQQVADGNNVSLAAAVSTNGSGQSVVTLTFSGTETDPVSGQHGGQLSLADGRYALIILSADVTGTNGFALDGDYNGTAGGNYVSPTDTLGGGPGQLHLYRDFGDANGDGVVDQLDLGKFRSTFNLSTGSAFYLSFLDADNSGTVDQVDLAQFRSRFNTSVF